MAYGIPIRSGDSQQYAYYWQLGSDTLIELTHFSAGQVREDPVTGDAPSTVGCTGPIIVHLRINETLQTGAVRKPHLPGDESVYLFFEFTIIIHSYLSQSQPREQIVR